MVIFSKDYEILMWNVKKKTIVKKKTQLADVEWHNWSCFLGWPVQGIWADCGDGTEINAVRINKDENLLIVGDGIGGVRLYAYPSNAENAPYKKYPGHSSHVTNVTFDYAGTFPFSREGWPRLRPLPVEARLAPFYYKWHVVLVHDPQA